MIEYKINKDKLVSKITNSIFNAKLNSYDEVIARTDREQSILDSLAAECLGKDVVGNCSNYPNGFSSREVKQFDSFIMSIIDARFKVSWKKGYRTDDPLIYRDNSIVISRLEVVND